MPLTPAAGRPTAQPVTLLMTDSPCGSKSADLPRIFDEPDPPSPRRSRVWLVFGPGPTSPCRNGIRSYNALIRNGFDSTRFPMQPEARRDGSAPFTPIHDNDAHFEQSPYAGTEELIQQIKETADKLVRDHASRGDVKLLSTALKELRYSFKVFAAYREHRKVTVFGSARLHADHPAYK